MMLPDQVPDPERDLSPASKEQRRRQEHIDRCHEATDGVDLVALALENPLEVIQSPRRGALLGHLPYIGDQMRLVKRITEGRYPSVHTLLFFACRPHVRGKTPSTVDIWKFIVCDCRYVEDSADLDRAYHAQLLAEELQTPEERAKEAVRTSEEKKARRNARWMIPALQKLSPARRALLTERDTFYTVWEKVSPKAPTWITDITDDELPWGYCLYRTTQVVKSFGSRWEEALELLQELDGIPIGSKGVAEPGRKAIHPKSIHSPGEDFMKFWSTILVDLTFTDDDIRDGRVLREHFREYRETLDPDDGVLDNTFIVVSSECIPPNLFDVRELRNLAPSVFWAWAYDANWDPPATKESDEDGYQGRLKVPYISLQAWFYAARYEGTDMKEMWKKAQGHPQQLWICNSKLLEEWDHEPYTLGDES